MRLRLLAALLALAPLAALADSEPPLIRHTPVAKANRGEGVTVSATMEDKDEIFAPTFYYRYVGGKGYSPIPMLKRGENTFVATVPGTADLEYWIEAYDEYGNGPSREGSPDRPHRVALADRSSAPRAAAPAPVAKEPVAKEPTSPGTVLAEEPPPPPVPEPEGDEVEAVAVRPELPPEAMVGQDDLQGEKPIYKQWWFLGTAAGVAAVGAVAIVLAAQPDPVYQNSFNASFKRP